MTTTIHFPNTPLEAKRKRPLPRISILRRIQLALSNRNAIHRKARAFAEECDELRRENKRLRAATHTLRTSLNNALAHGLSITGEKLRLEKKVRSLEQSVRNYERSRGLNVEAGKS